ncbi:MAG: hypothetical protein WCF67_00395 [Chitinophagaceae bacterium]
MTAMKILRFIHILAYLVITGQLMFYFFVMGDALKAVGIENFVEQRKIVDPLVRQRHVPVYYACLFLSVVIVILLAKHWRSPLFLSSLAALVCLVLDVVLAQRENGPINATINNTAMGTPGVDWEGLRTHWINMIRLRGAISMAGFISLLAGVFWNKA